VKDEKCLKKCENNSSLDPTLINNGGSGETGKRRSFIHEMMEENRIPKTVLYMSLETTRLTGRPRNRWQNEVREDGRIVGGEECQGNVHNREEWKKFLRTARNRRILHMPME
jgi:hypothetical protein